MIILNLVCSAGHKFEGWFASVESFDTQVRDALVSCPHCDSHRVERLPSVPHVVRGASESHPAQASSDTRALVSLLEAIAEASEDVGRRFPEEARRIHYAEADRRAIRGQATLAETRELLEKGIPVLPIPAKKRPH